MGSECYYELLRRSRLIALPRPIGKRTVEKYYPTHQIIRTPASSHFRGNWGLKRDMPQVKSSHISIDSLDTLEHQTLFKSGNTEFNFLERWKEMGIHLYTTNAGKDDINDTNRYERIHMVPFSPFTKLKNTTENSLHKNISEMSLKEFKNYIKKLRTKKKYFIDFMKQKQQEESFEDEQKRELQLSKSLGTQKTHLLINEYIKKFLNIPENNQKIRKTFPNSGLDYRPYGYLSPVIESNNLRKKLLPARILSIKPNNKKVLFGGIVAHVLEKSEIPNSINGTKEIRESVVNVTPKFAQISPEGKLEIYVKFMDTTKNHQLIQRKKFEKSELHHEKHF
ncbi:hypothetical protein T552_03098 [Pneumocystis carinii B80]|uniref:Uncharacterized protein n=1 Tax=Pneumocystis carinii (strain B80) TaxID=1408658 RepID=A0A0W4ZCV7_PNEC8|nr:hypothetical protein T552_03098 [Pneumocystis carinii B80]KTW26207.1 hypothetical protein T552_03098 [Pneumocystis carinii B80]